MTTLAELESQVRQIIENKFPTLMKFIKIKSDETFQYVHVQCMNMGCGVQCVEEFISEDIRLTCSLLAMFLADYNNYFTKGIPSCDKCVGEMRKYPYCQSVMPLVDYNAFRGIFDLWNRCNCPIINGFLAIILPAIEREHNVKTQIIDVMRVLPLPISTEIAWHIVE